MNDNDDGIEEKLSDIYDDIMAFIDVNDYCSVNKYLTDVDLKEISTEEMIMILTVTLPYDMFISERGKFYASSEKEIIERDEMEPYLLQGLDKFTPTKLYGNWGIR